MEIVKSTGCTAYYLEIDGKNISDFSIDELRNIAEILFNRFYMSKDGLIEFIDSTVDAQGEFESDLQRCDQCGDYVSKSILNID